MRLTREQRCEEDQRKHGDKPCMECRTCCLFYRQAESSLVHENGVLQRRLSELEAQVVRLDDMMLMRSRSMVGLEGEIKKWQACASEFEEDRDQWRDRAERLKEQVDDARANVELL